MHDRSSPIETPTTPSAPIFPLFASSPTRSHSRKTSLVSIQTVIPARRCSSSLPDNTSSTSPKHPIAIMRPLPLRPTLNTNPNSISNRITKPSQQPPRRSRSRSRSPRGRSPSPCQAAPWIRSVSPRPQRPTLTYNHAVSHISTKLIPLISVTTGAPHPAFPRSLLQYHLLTHAQLDELAMYYHQVAPPIRQTEQYPVSIPAWLNRDGAGLGGQDAVGLATKRRRWGRFLGLKGCESPTRRALEESGEEREMRELLEREWRRGVERRREEDRLRWKAEGWRERW